MATFDNLYRICYNKCNDDNKNVICHQTGKNALVSRFSSLGYKFTLNRQKRFTTNLHKNWKYKKHEIVRRRRTAGKVIPIYTEKAFC